MTLVWLLGHANPSITLNRYGHSMDDHKQESVEWLNALHAVESPVAPIHTQKLTLKRKT